MIWIVIGKVFRTLRELPMEIIGKLTLIAVIIGAAIILTVYCHGIITTEDKVSHCYIRTYGRGYSVMGGKRWRSDVEITYSEDYDRAVDLQNKNPICQQ